MPLFLNGSVSMKALTRTTLGSGKIHMANDVPLYQRDPEAWRVWLAEGNAKQPRKRVSADALIRDDAGRILLVDPNYKPGWDLPGGMAEANESPMDCVRRELREELGIDASPDVMLCVDWVPPHEPWDDMMAFIFYAGVLVGERIKDIRLLDGEIDKFEFCDEETAERRLRPRAWRRTRAALEALRMGRPAYLQDGQPIG
jgi:ADP-ribose pyrophosphatase YjhB (NUDIX family)